MKNLEIKLDTLKKCGEMLGYNQTTTSAIMTLPDDSRMTTTLNIFETPEGIVILNISNAKTIQFDTKEEFEVYFSKKFEVFDTDKEMWQTFTGMDDETWEEWNK